MCVCESVCVLGVDSAADERSVEVHPDPKPWMQRTFRRTGRAGATHTHTRTHTHTPSHLNAGVFTLSDVKPRTQMYATHAHKQMQTESKYKH